MILSVDKQPFNINKAYNKKTSRKVRVYHVETKIMLFCRTILQLEKCQQTKQRFERKGKKLPTKIN
jgi:hypothetical protein